MLFTWTKNHCKLVFASMTAPAEISEGCTFAPFSEQLVLKLFPGLPSLHLLTGYLNAQGIRVGLILLFQRQFKAQRVTCHEIPIGHLHHGGKKVRNEESVRMFNGLNQSNLHHKFLGIWIFKVQSMQVGRRLYLLSQPALPLKTLTVT